MLSSILVIWISDGTNNAKGSLRSTSLVCIKQKTRDES